MGKNRVEKEYFSVAELFDYCRISQRKLRDLLKELHQPYSHLPSWSCWSDHSD
ncbi:MAG: hypothetical protein HN417_11705 [Desulfobacula sp.]|nr:hypothetical protein [Desulfobacula sp.]